MEELNIEWMNDWKRKVNSDRVLEVIGKYFTADFLFDVGNYKYVVAIRNGKIVNVSDEINEINTWQFALRSSTEAWNKFLRKEPPPMYNDIWAIARNNKLKIEGDTKILWQNLRAFSWMLDLMK